MLTDLFPDPWLGFSHHQWGILLGGIVAGLVAIGGVAITLLFQHKQFRAQEANNAAALKEQLAEQAASLSAQLKAQAGESSRQREIAARGDLMTAIHDLGRSRNQGPPAWDLALKAVDLAINKWRIELQQRLEDRELSAELVRWTGTLSNLIRLPDERIGPFQEALILLMRAAVSIGSGPEDTSSVLASKLRALRESTIPKSLIEPAAGRSTT